MNRTVTVEDKKIFLDIYEDLAKELGWQMCYKDRQAAREKVPFSASIFINVEQFGKGHPKYPLIEKYFEKSEVETVDCTRRQDWWTAIVRMLDDTKLYLSEKDRKELYLDLRDLIGHRLSRKEF